MRLGTAGWDVFEGKSLASAGVAVWHPEGSRCVGEAG